MEKLTFNFQSINIPFLFDSLISRHKQKAFCHFNYSLFLGFTIDFTYFCTSQSLQKSVDSIYICNFFPLAEILIFFHSSVFADQNYFR